MNPRGLIGRLTGSKRPDTNVDPVRLFEEIHSVPVSPAELASTHSIPRPTVYRVLNPFVEAALIERNEDGFQLTVAGKVLLRAYETASRTIDTDLLAFLIGSLNRSTVLRRLAEHPARKAELAASETSPSRTTVQRILREYDAFGLVTRTDDGAYALTTFGTEVLAAFEQLVVAVGQVVEKVAFFNQFGDVADLSPEHFLTSELVTVTASDPYAVVDRTAELLEEYGGGFSQIRILTPVFSPYVFRLYGDVIGADTAIETVVSEAALTEAQGRWDFERFLDPSVNGSLDFRLHPGRIPYGIVLLGERSVLIGYADPDRNEAAIVTDDERLVEWATEQFQRYWDEATPSERLGRRATGYSID